MLSSSLAVASSLLLPQEVMSPAPTKTCGGLTVARPVGVMTVSFGDVLGRVSQVPGPVLSVHMATASARLTTRTCCARRRAAGFIGGPSERARLVGELYH